MAKEMLINVSEGEECRIALLNDGRLEELYMERTSATSHVGNIYKGRVTNVEPSIQAAFVDFGLGRNGFLHISDLMPTYFGRGGGDIVETVGKKMARRDRPPIQRCLRRGDEIIVQIIKEGIGTKGPTLSTYLSIPGRILVMMPGMGKMGVSKKIEDEVERKRLRQILDSLKPPKDVGFIIRTAGIGKTKTEIQRDLTYLSRLWATLEKKRKEPAPVELYTEGDLVTRTVRDVFSTDVDKIVVDNKEVAKRVKEVIKITNPRTKNRVDLFEEPVPLFHQYGIEKEIEQMYSRHVPLPSGGSLVIDSTEAIVAIDVNSGKFRDHSDAEMTAFKTDMEAADEIPRQLKLRDLGGVIICDFIDLRYERHRRELEQRLHDNFKRDRAKTKVLRMSQFGIIELTRQRMRPSLKRSIYFDCPHCKGAGLVKTPESMSLDVMRRLAIAAADQRVARVELSVCPDVSFYLLNKKRSQLARLEGETNKRIVIRTEQGLGLDEMRLDLFDARDGTVIIEELGMVMSQPPHTTQLGTRPAGGRRGGRFDDRRPPGGGRGGRGGRGGAQAKRPDPAAEAHDPRADIEDAEDALEELEERRERGIAAAADMGLMPTLAEDGPEPAVAKQRGVAEDDVEPDDEERAEGATDIDEGPDHTMGERPEGEFDRPGRGREGGRDGGGGQQRGGRRRRRGRRGRGGQGGQGAPGGAPQGQQNRQQGGGGRQPQPQPAGGGQRRDRSEPVGPAPEAFEEHEHDEIAPRGNRAVPAVPDLEPEDEPTPGNEVQPAPRGDQPAGEGGPRKRRRRRGGRGRRGRGRGKQDGEPRSAGGGNDQPAGDMPLDDNSGAVAGNGGGHDEQDEHDDADEARETRPAPKSSSSSSTSRRVVVADEQPVVKTGSADKHLVIDDDDDEEPIVPTPLPRPRSYTDLDAIPDDYE